MEYHNTFEEKTTQIGGHLASFHSGGPDLTLTIQMLCIIQHKPFRNDTLFHFNYFILLV